MFNSVRKDEKRRNLVKKFEIQRLQNKVLSQAISVINDRDDDLHSFIPLPKMKARVNRRNLTPLSNQIAEVGLNDQKTIRFSDKRIELKLSQSSLPKANVTRDLKATWQIKALKSTPRNSSRIRVRNRCIETGRSRAVLRFCKLSRICLREKASRGLISGVSKASW